MSAREELRATAAYLEQRAPIARDGAGSRHAAALRALADRIDAEMLAHGVVAALGSEPDKLVCESLARLDAPLQKEPR